MTLTSKERMMTHAEALYAYNSYAGMQEFIDGAAMAMSLGALDEGELPAILECHLESCQKAIAACQYYGWRDLTPTLEKQRDCLVTVIAEFKEELQRWRSQKRS